MSRRKRKQYRRNLKRENAKPLVLMRQELMVSSSKRIHKNTIRSLHKEQRKTAVLFIVTKRCHLGDVATVPLLNFLTVS